MALDATINIPFAVKLCTDANGYAYVEHPAISASCYGSVGKAKETLRKQIAEQIEEGLKTVKNYSTRAIGTVEGSVFIVRYHVGSWQYSIIGPGRNYGGSCHGRQSFEETLADANRHAESSFDGIAWECSL